MRIALNPLTPEQVIGINERVILDAHRKDPACKQRHVVVRDADLRSCIGAIFYQGASGYAHLPLEKMAGLLLYRIAQGQFFLDGNKRTAVVATTIFLRNHGLAPRLDRTAIRKSSCQFTNPCKLAWVGRGAAAEAEVRVPPLPWEGLISWFRT